MFSTSSSDFPTSIEGRWEIVVEKLPAKFFSSAEARFEINKQVSKGKSAYVGLALDHKNNFDIEEIYGIRWRSKADLGQNMGTYDQFRLVVGQYARFAVAAKLANIIELWEKGQLYGIICHFKAVKAFIRQFELRASAGTVMNKAFHLGILCY